MPGNSAKKTIESSGRGSKEESIKAATVWSALGTIPAAQDAPARYAGSTADTRDAANRSPGRRPGAAGGARHLPGAGPVPAPRGAGSLRAGSRGALPLAAPAAAGRPAPPG